MVAKKGSLLLNEETAQKVTVKRGEALIIEDEYGNRFAIFIEQTGNIKEIPSVNFIVSVGYTIQISDQMLEKVRLTARKIR